MRGVILLVALATPALADDEPGAEPKLITPTGNKPAAAPTTLGGRYSHLGQFELGLSFGVGLRAIAPYSDTVFCGSSDKTTSTGNAPVCTARSPFAVDLELGYGVAKSVDAFVELRLGLEHDFGADATSQGPRMLQVSPGARIFFSEAFHSKLFTTGQVVFDFADYKDGAGNGRGVDFGLRNVNGLWFDAHPNYGFYAFVGETATFVRWLQFELEAGIGVQGRYR